jgi:hypothetical protein
MTPNERRSPLQHALDPGGHRERLGHVLFDQQDRHAGGQQLGEHPVDPADDRG